MAYAAASGLVGMKREPCFGSTASFRLEASRPASHFFTVEGKRSLTFETTLPAGAPATAAPAALAGVTAATITENAAVAIAAVATAATAFGGAGTQTVVSGLEELDGEGWVLVVGVGVVVGDDEEEVDGEVPFGFWLGLKLVFGVVLGFVVGVDDVDGEVVGEKGGV
jgi:hypothetical protein